MEKYTDFSRKQAKLVSNLNMNIIKMEKKLKYEKFMVIFAKI